MFHPSGLYEERLHVRTRIFWLLEHGMFRTQRQFRDVLRRRMEFYRDHEDHVEIHQDQFLSLLVILLTWVAVIRVRVTVT
jgi:hypothetical protein